LPPHEYALQLPPVNDRFKSFRGSEFRRDQPLRSLGEVIRWWERRRFFFNCVVGCTGVITCVLLIICAFTADSTVGEPIGMPDGPLLGVFAIVFYGILANVFYTGGWISELLLGLVTTTKKASAFGVRVFRIGVYFAILVTFCPAVVCWSAFAIALLRGQKHGPPGE
jgi:hypothetical protein